MGKDYQEIDSRLQQWIERQPMFFVATAPTGGEGLINCSPKGLDTLRILSPRRLVYADIGGSGIETVAHLRDNGRIVIMLCAFDGPPKIFRFYGRGRVVEGPDAEYAALRERFPEQAIVRNFIVIDVERIRDSCGYGVPLMRFERQRDSLYNWYGKKTPDDIRAYRREKNARSLDGLPGLEFLD